MFRSFFFAGFECATGYNARGEWIDQVAATHHDKHADEDYERLRTVGIAAAREAIRWPLVDKGAGRYDFSTAEPFIRASEKHQIEVIWDLFHYGYPADLDLFTFCETAEEAWDCVCRHYGGMAEDLGCRDRGPN